MTAVIIQTDVFASQLDKYRNGTLTQKEGTQLWNMVDDFIYVQEVRTFKRPKPSYSRMMKKERDIFRQARVLAFYEFVDAHPAKTSSQLIVQFSKLFVLVEAALEMRRIGIHVSMKHVRRYEVRMAKIIFSALRVARQTSTVPSTAFVFNYWKEHYQFQGPKAKAKFLLFFEDIREAVWRHYDEQTTKARLMSIM